MESCPREAQQILVDFAAQHSVHAQVQAKPGRRTAGVERTAEEIKARYAQIFKI